ncbi:pilus assembly protein MshD [Methylophaga sp. 41_12_T18]|nr:pilus assembly protein MshD [Methylophaga sp. 41_12_T18]
MTVAHNMKQLGATLVELIITIVIISIALTGILSVVSLSSRHTADPMVQQQAVAIAESYLEEILLLPITDPDSIDEGSENRSLFDNVEDYDNWSDSGAVDQHGNAINGLEDYQVNVTINDATISGVTMKAVMVSVSRSGTDTIRLTGYRANY